MKIHHLTSSLILATITGCQSTSVFYESPYDNPHVLPPPGTVVELHSSLQFAANNSRSTIQNGQKIGTGRFSRFDPWCQFYLYEPKEAMASPRSIEPDRFTVTKSFQNVDFALSEPLQVARVGVGIGVPFYGRNDDVGSRTMKTTMRLRSEKQPHVHELRCGQDDDPYLQNYVTINEMIKTLGDIATLKFPENTQQPAQ